MSEQQLPATTAGITGEVITQLNDIQKQHSIGNLIDMESLQKSFTIAQGIGRLTKVIMENEPVVQCLMYLQGKKLGFRTDKQYPPEKVVECVVEALMRGLELTGNQFNLIAGNLYIPREGFEALLDKLDGMVDFYIDFGDFKKDKGTARVDFKATWKYKGVTDEMVGSVPVRVNDGMIVDAVYGKATRKIMARVYGKVTKSEAYFEERDASEINTTIVQDSPSNVKLTEGVGKMGQASDGPGDFGEFKGGQ